jgi:hypothetical protein
MCSGAVAGGSCPPPLFLRRVGKLSRLSESSRWSIGKSATEIGKSATKGIVMLLSGKNFYQKSCRRGGGGEDLKCCCREKVFLGPPWVFAGPPDQKSWLRLCIPCLINYHSINNTDPLPSIKQNNWQIRIFRPPCSGRTVFQASLPLLAR